MATISLNGIAHCYIDQPKSAEDYALQSLHHEFKQGGAYALLGPSGCGKSTLLNIISGLLKPTEGDVLFDRKVVTSLSPAQRNIAQVFQFPVVYDSMTVAENLAFPLKNIKMSKSQILHKVNDIAELLELTEILNKQAKNLSADQKQKVSMARGLVRENVSAILFDEPLTVIDPHLKWKLRRKLKQIHEQLNITMLYVTHDQLEAATFADKIAVMYEGKIVQFGTPQDLFERPNHTFVGYFIGSPGMNFITHNPGKPRSELEPLLAHLSAAQQAAISATSSTNVRLGIRPEYVRIIGSKTEKTLPAQYESIEHLGTFQIVSARLLDKTIKIRVAEDWQVISQTLYLECPANAVKLYIDDYLVAEPSASDLTNHE